MNRPKNTVEELNQRAYFSRRAPDLYTTYELTRTEALVLLKYQPYFAGKDVLDIGVGAGRTTVYLAPLARRYVGIDFSPAFIDFMNNAMPHVKAQLGDMRDLKEFAADEFDFVIGSFNVLDSVVHEDRLKTLSEVHRVLRPGGIFVFSSHNLAWELAGGRPKLQFSRNAISQVSLACRWIRQWINHAKVRKHRVYGDNYAVLNDEAHDFSILLYYIDQAFQRQQLEEKHFTVREVFGVFANTLAPDASDRESPFLMYVVQKAPLG